MKESTIYLNPISVYLQPKTMIYNSFIDVPERLRWIILEIIQLLDNNNIIYYSHEILKSFYLNKLFINDWYEPKQDCNLKCVKDTDLVNEVMAKIK